VKAGTPKPIRQVSSGPTHSLVFMIQLTMLIKMKYKIKTCTAVMVLFMSGISNLVIAQEGGTNINVLGSKVIAGIVYDYNYTLQSNGTSIIGLGRIKDDKYTVDTILLSEFEFESFKYKIKGKILSEVKKRLEDESDDRKKQIQLDADYQKERAKSVMETRIAEARSEAKKKIAEASFEAKKKIAEASFVEKNEQDTLNYEMEMMKVDFSEKHAELTLDSLKRESDAKSEAEKQQVQKEFKEKRAQLETEFEEKRSKVEFNKKEAEIKAEFERKKEEVEAEFKIKKEEVEAEFKRKKEEAEAELEKKKADVDAELYEKKNILEEISTKDKNKKQDEEIDLFISSIYFNIKNKIVLVDDEPQVAFLKLRKNTINCSYGKIYWSRFNDDMRWDGKFIGEVEFQIEKVQIEFEDGVMKNIVLDVLTPQDNYVHSYRNSLRFRNLVPVSVSSRNDDERFGRYGLFMTERESWIIDKISREQSKLLTKKILGFLDEKEKKLLYTDLQKQKVIKDTVTQITTKEIDSLITRMMFSDDKSIVSPLAGSIMVFFDKIEKESLEDFLTKNYYDSRGVKAFKSELKDSLYRQNGKDSLDRQNGKDSLDRQNGKKSLDRQNGKKSPDRRWEKYDKPLRNDKYRFWNDVRYHRYLALKYTKVGRVLSWPVGIEGALHNLFVSNLDSSNYSQKTKRWEKYDKPLRNDKYRFWNDVRYHRYLALKYTKVGRMLSWPVGIEGALHNLFANNNLYVSLADLIEYKNILDVDREDYSPRNGIVILTPESPVVELKKIKKSRILTSRAFSDLQGLQRENPNGLIQAEVSTRFLLNTVRNGSGSNNSGCFGYIEPKFIYSKIEDNNRSLVLTQNDLENSNTAQKVFRTNPVSLLRFQRYSFDIDLNVYRINIPAIKTNFRINYSAGISQINSLDSLAFDAMKNMFVPGDLTFENTLNCWKHGFSVTAQIKPEKRYGIHFTYDWRRYNSLSSNLIFENRFRPLHTLQTEAFLNTNEQNNNTLFFRARLSFMDEQIVENNFVQLQLGYLFDIFKNRTK
jgi:hypothetical protein